MIKTFYNSFTFARFPHPSKKVFDILKRRSYPRRNKTRQQKQPLSPASLTWKTRYPHFANPTNREVLGDKHTADLEVSPKSGSHSIRGLHVRFVSRQGTYCLRGAEWFDFDIVTG